MSGLVIDQTAPEVTLQIRQLRFDGAAALINFGSVVKDSCLADRPLPSQRCWHPALSLRMISVPAGYTVTEGPFASFAAGAVLCRVEHWRRSVPRLVRLRSGIRYVEGLLDPHDR